MIKNSFIILLSVFLLLSCKEEVNLTFSEINTLYEEGAVIEINIPKAEGQTTVSTAINLKIENHIANILNFSEENSDSIELKDAIAQFKKEYSNFKNDFEESALIWEAIFDGEVIYQSSSVVCLAINGYTNTGGAHGNMNITLYNFDAQTGEILELEDLINDISDFTELVKIHFKKETESNNEEGITDYFFGDEFHLPDNIGFNDDGILILYNVYEIASYAQGITEFTIPFEESEAYLINY